MLIFAVALLTLTSTSELQDPVAVETLPPPRRAEFVTLGTGGGPITRLNRSQPANAVVVNGAVYLFDVGGGVLRQLAAAGLGLNQVRAIFISHHHLDHDADLGPVLLTRWLLGGATPLPIRGPVGTEEMVRNLASAYRPVTLAPVSIGGRPKPPIASSVSAGDMDPTMDVPSVVYEDENIRVLAVTNAHYNYPEGSDYANYSRSYSFRIEAEGRSFVYTGDTGESDNLLLLAQNADVLVTEVIDLPAIERAMSQRPGAVRADLEATMAHMREDHLTPVQIGQLAEAANVGEVVLTHFVPGLDTEQSSVGYTTGLDSYFKGTVHLADDLDRF